MLPRSLKKNTKCFNAAGEKLSVVKHKLMLLKDELILLIKVAVAFTRRRRGVVIKDPEEESTAITHAKTKSKDKGKGMSYDDIRLIFEAKFNANMEFLLKSKEKIKEETNRALESINETPTQKAAKQKRSKENKDVEEIKQHLEIVPDEDDDVYTEVTPLARKVPVVDYQIIHLNNKPRYKIIRADETHELYEVVEVVTTAKLITEVIIAASAPVSAASIIIPAAEPNIPAVTITVAPVKVAVAFTRRRRGVVIKDPEEESTVVIKDPEEESTAITHAKTKSKDKGLGSSTIIPLPLSLVSAGVIIVDSSSGSLITTPLLRLVEAAITLTGASVIVTARIFGSAAEIIVLAALTGVLEAVTTFVISLAVLHEELNQDIDWDVAIDHVKQKAKDDPFTQRYQVMKKRPQIEAQARRNMITYLKNTVGFRLDYFKGMSYDDIRPIFEAKFNANMKFLLRSKEQIKEEANRALESINETLAQKAAKRRRLKENKDATPLAKKVPVVDYQIIQLNNKPRYKIIRADETHQLYVSFITLLKNFDREDFESLWSIVEERFSTSKPNNFSDEYLLTTLRIMFGRSDGQDNEQMLNVVRLQVEEQSEMSLELIRFTRYQLQEDAAKLKLKLLMKSAADAGSNEEITKVKDPLSKGPHKWYQSSQLTSLSYKPSTKLTFYKAFFSSQWKFLIHTILQSLSAKRTSWNEFSSAMASAVIRLFTGRKFNFSKYIFDSFVRNVDSSSKFYMYPRFIQLIIQNQLDEQVQDDAVVAAAPKDVTVVVKETEALYACAALTRQVEHLEHDKVAQDLEITKLKIRVKKLERANKVKPLKLRRLRKVGTFQRIKSSDDTIMEDVVNQGRMIDELDRDEGVALMGEKEEEKKAEEVKVIFDDAQVEGRQAKIQVEIYQIDMDHPSKVLSMHKVTIAKLIIEVVTAASTPVSAASTIIPAAELNILAVTITAAPVKVVAASNRRRRGVVIRDPKEESTTITPAKTKDK
nr:glutamic acid-rich protein-like [Tanacetum cinerariifolium]